MSHPPIPTWEQWFMMKAYTAASKSKDRSTHVGAVVIGPDNEVRTSGYNSFPRKIEDKEERHVRPQKYLWTEHAERNAIYNAARTGVALKDCTMFCMWFPCHECARAILGAGISKIVYHKQFQEAFIDADVWTDVWDESHQVSNEMLREAGVEIVEWDGHLLPVMPYKSGKYIDLYGDYNGIPWTRCKKSD